MHTRRLRQQHGGAKRGCLIAAWVVILGLVAFVAAVVIWVAPALVKKYEITNVAITAQVSPNASMLVSERFSYHFQGSYTRVFRDIPLSTGQTIEILSVVGPEGPLKRLPDTWTPAAGPPSVGGPDDVAPTLVPWASIAPEERPRGFYRLTGYYDAGEYARLEAFARLEDRDATFTFTYRITGVATRWKDVSELYWKFIGDEWDVGMDHVEVTITLPGVSSKSQVRAWGHGPYNGVVTIAPDGVVDLAVDDLPAQTFVEARVLFPQAALATTETNPSAMEQSVLAQETILADQANARRVAAREQADNEHAADVLAWTVVSLISVVGVVLWLVLFLTFGREHKPSFSGQYFRELPAELPPAVVGVLWRMGGQGNEDLSATLLDLANRGVIRLEPAMGAGGGLFGGGQVPTFRLTLDPTKVADIDALDRLLLEFLFNMVAPTGTLTMIELKDWAKANQKEFQAGIAGWKSAVMARATEMRFLEKSGGKARWGVFAYGLLLMAGTWLMFMGSSEWKVLYGLVVGLFMLSTATVMKRRTPEAAELYAKYKGLYNYMKDFGRLQEKPPTAVVLWEYFLVLAVVFGIADEVMESMRVAVPEVANDPTFTSVWWFTAPAYAGSFGGGNGFSAFSSGLSAAVVAGTPSSSGGGGGGGFSGGGGGGGGGAD